MRRVCERCCNVSRHRLSRGLCVACYQAVKRAGELDAYPIKPRTRLVCAVCGGPNYSGGYCRRHWDGVPKPKPEGRNMGSWCGGEGVILYANPKVGRCAMGIEWAVLGEGMVDDEPCYRVEWEHGDDWTPKHGIEIIAVGEVDEWPM